MIQLLTEMDGFQEINDVIVIAATNRPEILDPAIVRPGRLNELIYISLPDVVAREEIFKIGCRGMQLAGDVDLKSLAQQTNGYSGAEIIQICSAAGYNSILRTLEDDQIMMIDFQKALVEIRPRVSKELISGYESFGKTSSLFK